MKFRTIGINIGKTSSGIKLMDGGCALVENGKPITAISEERLSRKKYDGGFIRSFYYCLESNGLKTKDIDLFVFSNCCDEPLGHSFLRKVLSSENLSIPKEKIMINRSHHLAHAYSAFFLSPFDSALILVADNEGNILEKKFSNYRLNRMERTSVYYGNRNEIKLISRYHDGYKQLGVGAAYNYVTQWIGFASHQEAGKTMALAAYGKDDLKNLKIFGKNKKCLLGNRSDFTEQIFEIRNYLLRKKKIDINDFRNDTYRPSKMQKEVAYLIQKETERILIEIVSENIRKKPTNNLCIAGGVGLNCVANYKLLENTTINNIFIQPASGDSGQPLGNALIGYYSLCNSKDINGYNLENIYLGRKYKKRDIVKALKEIDGRIRISETDGDNYSKIAKLLEKGKIIGLYQNQSEFGPRALGNRSIIADPRNEKTKEKLFQIKAREYYRPFAPVILEESFKDYFECRKTDRSSFMLLAIPAKKAKINEIPSVIHLDGTARVQTVNSRQNKRYYNIIKEFRSLTGIPVLLNTSFNRSGEPLVETPEDALRCFKETEIDCLILGDYLLEKI